jgi:D-alanine-D-alanine ligase
MGSSVGVCKVRNETEFKKGVTDAFKFDSKIILEEFIRGQEIECAVLGNANPVASIPGEIIANQEFYSYDAKYIDEGSVVEIPAKLSDRTIGKIREIAVKVFRTLECEGMGRVDLFVKDNGDIVVNEINTIPGFTAISMYPKLWEASGMPLPKLLDKLIELAMERFKREHKLKTSI